MKQKRKGMSTATRILLCSWCVLMLLVTFFIVKWAWNLSKEDVYAGAAGADNISGVSKDELGNHDRDDKKPDGDRTDSAETVTQAPQEQVTFVTEYNRMGEYTEVYGERTGVPYGLRYPVCGDAETGEAVKLAAEALVEEHVAEILNTYGRKPKLVIDYEDGETAGLYSVLFYIETEIDGKKETATKGWIYNKKEAKVADAETLFMDRAYVYVAEQVNALQAAEESNPDATGDAETSGFSGIREEFPAYLLKEEGAVFYYEQGGTTKEILIPYQEVYTYMEVTINGTVWADQIRELDPEKPMIALTFDDGPSHLQTPRLLEILDKYGVKSTFFVLGDRITWGESNKKTLRMVYDAGHEIGSHTYSHSHLRQLSEEEITEEIVKTRDMIYSVIGEYPVFVRPPYGEYDDKVKKYAYAPLVNWNTESLDWSYRDKDKIAEQVIKEVKDGGIVLMHDIYEFTVDAVELIIPELQARGYQLVTVRELLYYNDVELENGYVYHSSYN